MVYVFVFAPVYIEIPVVVVFFHDDSICQRNVCVEGCVNMCALVSVLTRSLCTSEISRYHRYLTFKRNHKQILGNRVLFVQSIKYLKK